MIDVTQITNTDFLVFIAIAAFKLLCHKVLFKIEKTIATVTKWASFYENSKIQW